MASAIFTATRPRNEPVLGYAPGSPERRALRAELERLAGQVVEITTTAVTSSRSGTGRAPPRWRVRSRPRARPIASGRACPGRSAPPCSSGRPSCSRARTG